MDWLFLVGFIPIAAVFLFMIYEVVSYKEPPKESTSDDPWRASWTSSTMQNER